MTAPTHLKVEHLDHPLGLMMHQPRLSWHLPDGARCQLAYQLRAGEWDSGQVESATSILVPYDGPTLRSGQRIDWTVRVWTDLGQSDWAQPAWWEMGLLSIDDWEAQWIEPPHTTREPSTPRHPAWYLHTTCTLPHNIQRARLYATAHGIYELAINGKRVGNAELTPGFTNIDTQLHAQTFAVSDLVVPGKNVLTAVVSGGWLTWARRLRDRDQRPGLLAQLDVYDDAGTRVRIGTGPDWTAASGPLLRADLQHGHEVDLSRRGKFWFSPGATAAAGSIAVSVVEHDLSRLTSSPAPPVRRVEELRPVTVARIAPLRHVVDLGQNINGWIRLSNLGKAGTALTLTHGEVLDSTGDVTVEHINDSPPEHARFFQSDHVIASGKPGEYVELRHATHGFRYVRVEGASNLTVDDVTGVVVHTDNRRTGWFECSDQRINRLHDAVVWTLRGNMCDIPTDCPTRERAGWTADWQLSFLTSAFLFDVAGFTTKWLRDLAAEQLPSGAVRHCAPEHMPDEIQSEAGMPPGSAGWGDAAVIVPWRAYLVYGDTDLLRAQWSSMTAWLRYAAQRARERRHHARVAQRQIPAEHERYIWDTGFHWGEWLEPDMLPNNAGREDMQAYVTGLSDADHGHIATAYLYHSASLMAKIANVIGQDDDALRYAELAAVTRTGWQQEFLSSDNKLRPDTQSNYVRALTFGLVPSAHRTQVSQRLCDLIRQAGTRLATGHLATPDLLPALADNGHTDLAYQLLLQEEAPSWLAMLNRGATTMWEHWSGLDEAGRPSAPAGVGSLNHNSKGAVASFLHRHVAGIQILDHAPAYRTFRIAPQPGGGLTFARAMHDSPYGRIESSWTVENDSFVLDVVVPPGTLAEVALPDGQLVEVQAGRARHRCRMPSVPVQSA
ncbi:family 78 glycoside hydrolase catalytic domain [Phytoactinopolyspora limicola]|uniref:family 78 glycoside hydrolase catalytic domain n=1 Tax=Phytoactinopolyspora limicola TaxID=2715536 RepID=UPI00140CC63E|nr:family 78 glycoside hydrolase catalytic domain [Phytoactinopolyspora limicola]